MRGALGVRRSALLPVVTWRYFSTSILLLLCLYFAFLLGVDMLFGALLEFCWLANNIIFLFGSTADNVFS